MLIVRTHYRFAIVGLVMAAAFVVSQLATDPLSNAPAQELVRFAFIILCPPSLISIPIIDAEVGTSGFFFLWTIIAVLNALFYASVAAVVTRRLKKVG